MLHLHWHTWVPPFLLVNKSFKLETSFSATQLEVSVAVLYLWNKVTRFVTVQVIETSYCVVLSLKRRQEAESTTLARLLEPAGPAR